ncbi:MAG: chemoreceptor glutamine deamidase CheD [Pseudomonadales bacterium]
MYEHARADLPASAISSSLALPGFEHISRTWDEKAKIYIARILPGEYYVTAGDKITTVLGSCVSACVRDPVTGVGGMNHFMLPGESTRSNSSRANAGLVTRFGLEAMEVMIEALLKLGAHKDRLEFKLFGGGSVLDMPQSNVGNRNIDFVRRFIYQSGFSLLAEDLGGIYPRKIAYSPKDGRVMVRKLRTLPVKLLNEQEHSYRRSIERPVR